MILPNQAPPVDRSQRASIDAAPGFRRENTVVACDGIARPQSEHIATGLPTAQPGFCHCLVLNPEP